MLRTWKSEKRSIQKWSCRLKLYSTPPPNEICIKSLTILRCLWVKDKPEDRDSCRFSFYPESLNSHTFRSSDLAQLSWLYSTILYCIFDTINKKQKKKSPSRCFVGTRAVYFPFSSLMFVDIHNISDNYYNYNKRIGNHKPPHPLPSQSRCQT